MLMNPLEQDLPLEFDEARAELSGDEPAAAVVPRHGPGSRAVAAVVCGILAGMLISGALANGCSFYFPEERHAGTTWLFLWGEHWAIRVLASWASAYGAGFVAGIVARQRGKVWAGIAAVPSTVCWLAIALIGWTQKVPFFTGTYEVETSIGNKLAASLLVLTIIPIGCYGGLAGEEQGQSLGEHFDSRRFTLLGVKWYHYMWLPILFQLLLTQASWAFLYGFEWLRNTWRAGLSLFSVVPWIFTVLIWVTLSIMATGAAKCYGVLSGLEGLPSARSRAVQVLKYGFGFPLLAAILQTLVGLAHFGLLKLLGHGEGSPGG
jgi:hypothetical protein